MIIAVGGDVLLHIYDHGLSFTGNDLGSSRMVWNKMEVIHFKSYYRMMV